VGQLKIRKKTRYGPKGHSCLEIEGCLGRVEGFTSENSMARQETQVVIANRYAREQIRGIVKEDIRKGCLFVVQKLIECVA